MAQTITLQRGAVTLTSAAAASLLFTNGATGFATRMVIGYLNIRAVSATTNLICNLGVRRSGASAGNDSVFAAASGGHSGYTTTGFSFSPHDTAFNSFAYSSTQGGATKTFTGGDVALGNAIGTGAAYFLGAGVWYYGFGFAWYNSTVMIGPSDQVYAYYESASAATATLTYSIVLITEL